MSSTLEWVLEGTNRELSGQRARLALVSKAWCVVVQHTPSFRSRISDQQSPEMNTLALIRSQNAPIELRFSFDRTSEMKLLSAIDSFTMACRHIRRWRIARVVFAEDDQQHVFAVYDLLTKPAPLLEQVEINNPGNLGVVLDLFGGQADRLKSVSVTGVCFPWSNGMLPGLDTLKLSNIGINPPIIGNILLILQSSPSLSTLELSRIPFDPTLESTSDHPPIQLQHLRSLHFGPLGAQTQFILLRHIQAPPCERLHLRCTLAAGDAAPFFSLIRTFIPRAVVPAGATVDLDIGPNYMLYTLSSLSCHLCLSIDGASIHTILAPLFSILPPSLLEINTHIIILDHIPLDETHAVLALANTGRVVSLTEYTHGPGVPTITLEGMAEPLHDGDWLFPNLQELIIESEEVSAEILSRMVHARYGIAPSANRLPLPFTKLTVRQKGGSGSYGAVLEAIVGENVLGRSEDDALKD